MVEQPSSTQHYISVQTNPALIPSQINPMHSVESYLTPIFILSTHQSTRIQRGSSTPTSSL